MRFAVVLAPLAAVLLSAGIARADDVRYYQENGVTYCETRQVVQRPVTEITHQPTDRTVYREQLRTEMQDTTHVYSVPVTEWRWEAYWRGRWNPFMQPYLDQRLVPHTRWETHTAKAQVPVFRREVVAEVRTEHVPVVTQRYVNEEIIRRVAVSGQAANQPIAEVARREAIGGVSRLDGAPPRQVSSDAWRPATTIR